jgi:hypothetical protein
MNIAEAISTHRDLIERLKIECGEQLRTATEANNELYDDLWILRYVLSHLNEKKMDPFQKMKDAIVSTLEWRTQHRELLAKLRTGAPGPHDALLSKYSISDLHKTTKDGRPFIVLRNGISNIKLLMEHATEDQIYEYFCFSKEYIFHLMDARSRRTGRLIKAVGVMDMKGATMFGGMSQPFFKGMGKAQKEGELRYPQFQDITILINNPTWLNVVLSIAKVFVSKRTFEKLKTCPGRTSTGDIRTCPYVAANFDLDSIPTFLGGTCTCPHKAPPGVDMTIGACCRGFPNRWKTLLTAEDIAKLDETPLRQMELQSESAEGVDSSSPSETKTPAATASNKTTAAPSVEGLNSTD